MTKRIVVALMGPTGSGKARLAVAAATEAGAVLVSCDSMKVYRGLDVGTAKPPPAERGRWVGLDLVDPWERFDARRFRGLVDGLLAETDPARPLLLSGGTMLYLKAATEGLADAPPRDAAVRERLRAEAAAEGTEALHARLAAVDPAAAGRIHPNDARRIVRALEVHEVSGRPLSSFHGQFGRVRPGVRRRVLAVERERGDMDRRIDARVDRMMAAGWADECRRLVADPRGVSTEAAQALGYRELLDWVEAGEDAGALGPVVERIKTATRRFARRQLTWLRRVDDLERLPVAEGDDVRKHTTRVVQALRGLGGARDGSSSV